MTSLLLTWLNDDVRLHRPVRVLERDLANGYLLAEILQRHGLEDRLDEYRDTADIPTRVHNLELLGRTMAAAGLGELSLADRRHVLMENRSAILQILLRVKEFLDARGKRVSATQQQLQTVATRVYEPRRQPPGDVARDVEERFVEETTTKYHPTEVAFSKDINMDVYQRRFVQAQWAAENEAIQHQARAKAANDADAANGKAALRSHLQDKRDFIRKWDSERLQHWKRTQRRHLQAEGEDLRLELTLEERRRRFREQALAETQADAIDGVVQFEKNMNRLGLASGTEHALRAIPSSDPGPLAHLEKMEARVVELDFRPSNNVKMMKELRARRKAQLAAEKDRRMRRMKAISDSKAAAAALNSQTEVAYAATAHNIDGKTLPSSTPVEISDSMASPRTKYLEEHLEELETNYTRLREAGLQRRDKTMTNVAEIRAARRMKTQAKNTAIGLELVDALVTLALALVTKRPESDLEWQNIKRDLFLASPVSAARSPNSEQNREIHEEVRRQVLEFATLSESWRAYASELEVEGACESLAVANKISGFVDSVINPPQNHDVFATLDWTPLHCSKIVAAYSFDERAHGIMRTVSIEHGLCYIDVDELIDECIKYSYDPAKQADIIASLSPRERDLGVFGPKASALRQKNAPINDALAVEIVVAAIVLARSSTNSLEDSGVERRSSLSGCMLHNFPRTVDEMKLLEKALLSLHTHDDEAKAARLIALDAIVPGAATDDGVRTYSSYVDAVVVLPAWSPPRPPTSQEHTPPETAPGTASADRRRSSTLPPQSSDSKRQSNADKPDPEVVEALKRLELRQQVVDTFVRISRVARIDQRDMDFNVIREAAHLCIEVCTNQPSDSLDNKSQVIDIMMGSPIPTDIAIARDLRRSRMTDSVRVAWMVASGELALDHQALSTMLLKMKKLDDTFVSRLQQHMLVLRDAIVDQSAASRSLPLELDECLKTDETRLQEVLRGASRRLSSNNHEEHNAERVLNDTEVQLGDVIEKQRVLANKLVGIWAEQSPRTLPCLETILRLVPMICLELKEHLLDAAELLSVELYSRIPFLGRQKCDGKLEVPLAVVKGLGEALAALEEKLNETRLSEDVRRILAPIIAMTMALETDSQPISATRSSAPTSEIDERRLLSARVQMVLAQCTALLRCVLTLFDQTERRYVRDIQWLRTYILRDVQVKNAVIPVVLEQLRTVRVSHWPDTYYIIRRCPPRADAHRLPRHQQGQLLSLNQLYSIISAFQLRERTHGLERLISPQDFVTTMVELGQNLQGKWGDSSALATLATRCCVSSSSSGDGLIAWRLVFFGIFCAEYLGIPRLEDLVSFCEHVRGLQIDGSGSTTLPELVSLDAFEQLPLWFEEHIAEHDESLVAQCKSLLFSLFASDAEPTRVQLLPMLLTWCAAPRFAVNLRPDHAEPLLPSFSRGLYRALVVLCHWEDRGESQRRLSPGLMSRLLAFADIDVAESSKLLRDEGWGETDVDAFLAVCKADAPALSSRLLLLNACAALLGDDPEEM